jgi:hypothetical protein
MTSGILNERRKLHTNSTLSTSNTTWTYSYVRLSLDFWCATIATDNLSYGTVSKVAMMRGKQRGDQ